MNDVGVILGRAEGVWRELAEAEALIGPGRRIVVIAVNKAGRDYPGRVQHWVSAHPDLIPFWMEQRHKKLRLPEHACQLWTGIYNGNKCGGGRIKYPITYLKSNGGSSGLLAVEVALHLKLPAILCGVPLEATGRYDTPTLWREGEVYRQAWLERLDELKPVIRSMSGWTQALLGAPTQEWLDAGAV